MLRKFSIIMVVVFLVSVGNQMQVRSIDLRLYHGLRTSALPHLHTFFHTLTGCNCARHHRHLHGGTDDCGPIQVRFILGYIFILVWTLGACERVCPSQMIVDPYR